MSELTDAAKAEIQAAIAIVRADKHDKMLRQIAKNTTKEEPAVPPVVPPVPPVVPPVVSPVVPPPPVAPPAPTPPVDTPPAKRKSLWWGELD